MKHLRENLQDIGTIRYNHHAKELYFRELRAFTFVSEGMGIFRTLPNI